jgi:hypothetical protein
MNKSIAKWALLLVMCVILFGLVCVASVYRWPTVFTLEEEQRISYEELTYQIEPSTLIQSLQQGRPDVFILNTATPEVIAQQADIPVPWKQVDYYDIAKSFSQSVLHDPLDNWKLRKMFFDGSCKNISIGFQVGGVAVFRSEQIRERSSRVIRHIQIFAKESQMYYASEEIYPQLWQWQALDLAQINISAEKAIEIAENAGGAAFRKKYDNRCYIYNSIEAEGKYRGWWVHYRANDNYSLTFDVVVDPLTGEYKIIH